jgi:predicted RNase H-like nuclease
MGDSEYNEILFSGFDAAWGARNSGAICNLALQEDGSLRLDCDPIIANWDQAIAQASQAKAVGLHVWAIDQPICVQNETRCRPVDQDLSRALMAGFGCGAFPANLRNPCWARHARIWDFVHSLEEHNYVHNPMAVPSAKNGRYYFECYPHPALLGVFGLDRILKYKIRHHNTSDWRKLIEFLRSLATSELPVRNICSFVQEGLAQNKVNEDKLDSIICSYTAAYWWKFGIKRSTMIGDLATGYIVTPHSNPTYAALANVFSGRMNQQGPACGTSQTGTPPGQTALSSMDQPMTATTTGPDELPAEPPNDWSNPVELTATDTSNLWRTSRGAVINSWMGADRMTGWRLWVRFIDEDGQPAVLFVPFGNQGNQEGGMQAARQQMNRDLWNFLVADAARTNPHRFQVCYRYEQMH